MTAKSPTTTDVDDSSERTPIRDGTVLRDTEENRTVLVTGFEGNFMTAVEIENPGAAEGVGPIPFEGHEEAFNFLAEGGRFAPVE